MAELSETDAARPFPLAAQFTLGFFYWLFFLLVMEPDNILRAVHAGVALPWSEEVIRMVGASVLGASVTPLLFALVTRFPIEGERLWRRAAIETAGAAVTAAALIVVSSLLASWFLATGRRPLALAIGEDFAANWTLLVFSIAGLLAIFHAIRLFVQSRHREHAPTSPPPAYLVRVAVKARGSISFVELDDVEWIEAQGNYLALHVGAATHLIRESLAGFEAKLDPKRFARIHRRTIVAIPCVRDITPLGAGDALLRLKDGTELRVSRSFRERIAASQS